MHLHRGFEFRRAKPDLSPTFFVHRATSPAHRVFRTIGRLEQTYALTPAIGEIAFWGTEGCIGEQGELFGSSASGEGTKCG